MTNKRLDETTINTSLDAFLHGAQKGDIHQARRLHEMLDRMLTEREVNDRQLWLTDHGKMLLAEMHRQLSKCEGDEEHLRNAVLDAVQLKPRKVSQKDTCTFVRDLKIAIAVANELCEARDSGGTPDVSRAAEIIAENGGFDLDATAIGEVYEEIASTVGGFREIARC